MSTFGQRLKEERKRIGLNQTDFAAAGGVLKGAQVNYEQDDRLPSAEYLRDLRKIGVDILYVLTGELSPTGLTSDEHSLISGFRALDQRGKTGVIALISGLTVAPDASLNNIKGDVGQIIHGDITAPQSFVVGRKKK